MKKILSAVLGLVVAFAGASAVLAVTIESTATQKIQTFTLAPGQSSEVFKEYGNIRVSLTGIEISQSSTNCVGGNCVSSQLPVASVFVEDCDFSSCTTIPTAPASSIPKTTTLSGSGINSTQPQVSGQSVPTAPTQDVYREMVIERVEIAPVLAAGQLRLTLTRGVPITAFGTSIKFSAYNGVVALFELSPAPANVITTSVAVSKPPMTDGNTDTTTSDGDVPTQNVPVRFAVKVPTAPNNYTYVSSVNADGNTTLTLESDARGVIEPGAGSDVPKIEVLVENELTVDNGKPYLNDQEVKVSPDVAIEKVKESVGEPDPTKVVLKYEKDVPVYKVNSTIPVKFLAIFSAKMKVVATVDAETGEVVSVKNPWWNFLARK